MRSPHVLLSAALGIGCVAASANATVLFFDDFEAPVSSATYWPETSDNDPTMPVIGANPWTVVESPSYFVQEVRHQQFLPGGTYPHNAGNPPIPPAGSLGYPEFAAAEGSQYLHVLQNLASGQAWITLSTADQTAIAAGNYVKISMKTFGLSGHDGWHSGMYLIGWDSGVGSFAGRTFDVAIKESAYGVDGNVAFYTGGGTVPTPLIHNVNTWEDLVLEIQPLSKTYTITLDGQSVSGFWTGSATNIQTISLTPYDVGGVFRVGFDNVLIEVPEPAALTIVGLASALLALRRR
jgi:hypothetical protein